jgi:hypothetical protein
MTKYSKYFPQRVIDVGTGDDSQVPRLILSTDLGNTEQRYITLSYCWGTSGNLVTTTSNLYERQSELAIDDMPKTLKDAISITRRLGVQFLWVDALCIFQGTDQDAVEDWQRQSAEMDQIYGNSFLTIAAGAATDVHQGIFRELKVSNKYFVLPMNNDRSLIFTTGHQPHKASSSQIEHLYTRSWAMQERMLSRRLVIYGEKHIFWQCSHRYCTEEGKSAGDNLNMRSLLQSKLDAYKTNRYLWRELVHNYSLSRATLETDKLPALSGLARTLQKHSEDEYLAGLWKNTIQMDLQWRLSRPPLQSKQPISRPKQYRAPSWTWASVDGDVEWPLTTSRAEVTLVDYKIEPSGLDKFGQISNGWIELDAMMVTLFCVIAKGNQYFLVWPREALLDHLPDSFGYLNIDGPYPPSSDSEFADWGEVTQTELFILRLDESEGIAMLPVNKLENTYRRIGILQFPRAWSSSDTGYEYPLWNWKNDVVRMI